MDEKFGGKKNNMNNIWLKSQGNLIVKDGSIRLMVSHDFIKYYKSLIDKEVKMFTHTPAHGAHITVYREDKSGKLDPEKAAFIKKFQKNRPIVFEYNIEIIMGGLTKDFRNWYMKVRSIQLDEIAKYLGINQDFHLTISNTKGGIRPYIFYK